MNSIRGEGRFFTSDRDVFYRLLGRDGEVESEASRAQKNLILAFIAALQAFGPIPEDEKPKVPEEAAELCLYYQMKYLIVTFSFPVALRKQMDLFASERLPKIPGWNGAKDYPVIRQQPKSDTRLIFYAKFKRLQ